MDNQFQVDDAVYVAIPHREDEIPETVESRILSGFKSEAGFWWYMVAGQPRIVPEDRIRPRAEETRALEAA